MEKEASFRESDGERSSSPSGSSFRNKLKRFDVVQKPLIPKDPETISVSEHTSLDWITKGGKVASHNAGGGTHSMSFKSLPVDWLTNKRGQVSSHHADVMLASEHAVQRSLPARTPKQAAEESVTAEECEPATGVKEKMRQLEQQIQDGRSAGASQPAFSSTPKGTPRALSLTAAAAAGGPMSNGTMGTPLAAKGRSISVAHVMGDTVPPGRQSSGVLTRINAVPQESTATRSSISSSLLSPSPTTGGTHRGRSPESMAPLPPAAVSEGTHRGRSPEGIVPLPPLPPGAVSKEEEGSEDAASRGDNVLGRKTWMLGESMDESELRRRVTQLEIELHASLVRTNIIERALAAKESAPRRVAPLPLEAQAVRIVMQPIDDKALKEAHSIISQGYKAFMEKLQNVRDALESAEAELAAERASASFCNVKEEGSV